MINPAKPVVMILMFIEVIENICARERKKNIFIQCSKIFFVWLRKFIISD